MQVCTFTGYCSWVRNAHWLRIPKEHDTGVNSSRLRCAGREKKQSGGSQKNFDEKYMILAK